MLNDDDAARQIPWQARDDRLQSLRAARRGADCHEPLARARNNFLDGFGRRRHAGNRRFLSEYKTRAAFDFDSARGRRFAWLRLVNERLTHGEIFPCMSLGG